MIRRATSPSFLARLAAPLLGAALLPALVGCATGRSPYSGFLVDYSNLEPSPRVDGALVYRNPAAEIGDYRAVLVQPVVVDFAPGAKGVTLDPDTLAELTTYFEEELSDGLRERNMLATRPGEGVLRARIAITDIHTSIPALNVHPLTKATGAGRGGASVEMELLDSITGERVFAGVDTRSGSMLAVAPGLSHLGQAKEVIRFWVTRLLEGIDEARGTAAAR